jgi:phosphatidylglycerophosphatase C
VSAPDAYQSSPDAGPEAEAEPTEGEAELGASIVVAAFDVDGTLTRGDTLLPFLRELCGDMSVAVAAVCEARSLLLATRGLVSRDEAKARLLQRLLAGRDAAAVGAAGRDYGGRVARSKITSVMLARVRHHQSSGHRVVLASASPDVYIDELGRLLGANAVICTRLEKGADGRLTGRLDGGNCRAAEKARRVREWIDTEAPDAELWAYGDSASDDPMLALAAHPVRVRRGALRQA